jgi:hypothetical protein
MDGFVMSLPRPEPPRRTRMDADPRPYTRWWWFANRIDPRDIDRQARWCAQNGFGGVEIAWVYPLPGGEPGAPFLSAEWSALAARAREACRALGLGCDFTFGSLWPFGGSFVGDRDASRTWRGPTGQVLDRSWETAHGRRDCRVIDHLSAESLGRYAAVMGAALPRAAAEEAGSLFCDSWEVEGAGLWTDGFGEEFIRRFGYDVAPLMERLDVRPDARFDYRSLLAEYVIREFYAPFTRICHGLGAASRVQCHGAPTDLLAAYASVDVPESETVLFPPEFSSIAASAALLRGLRTVSAEAFTCLYGWVAWPATGPRMGRERPGDLALVADALFASGVNHVVWHGMPFQADGGRARFYATVHVGPDGGLAGSLPALNAYLAEASGLMKRGRAYARVACLLPLEDAWMEGELAPELRGPSAAHHWELHHLARPTEARPYAPAWISASFLGAAEVEDGRLAVGDASFEALFVDSRWLCRDALRTIVGLAEAGLPVVLKRMPREPGRRASPDYDGLLRRLASHPRVHPTLAAVPGLRPVLAAASPPPYWVRRDGSRYTVFLAHPLAAEVRYPLPYGFADGAGPVEMAATLHLGGAPRDITLSWPGRGAILLEAEGDSVSQRALGHREEEWT